MFGSMGGLGSSMIGGGLNNIIGMFSPKAAGKRREAEQLLAEAFQNYVNAPIFKKDEAMRTLMAVMAILGGTNNRQNNLLDFLLNGNNPFAGTWNQNRGGNNFGLDFSSNSMGIPNNMPIADISTTSPVAGTSTGM